ncbi:chloride channel protein [Mycobacterium lepraemurium]|nr:chloride channel protein [Mycobacterium lepraemurium]ATA27420.1 chloride channel protein [Mycobacterium lepraemurium]
MPAPRSDRNALDFFCAVIIVGVLAGIAGVATTLVLRVVHHAAYHYSFGALLAGVAASSPIRRVLGPMVGAALAGLGWWLLRRCTDVPPLAGALFAVRILLRTWRLRAVGAAFMPSGVAVAVGSAVTGDQPDLRWPVEESTYLLTAHGLLLAAVALAVGLVFNRLMAVARPARPMRTWTLIPALAGAGLVTGVCSHWWPELPGNGRSILTVSLASGMTLASALAILLLKPVLTALFLRAGGAGGLLTPSLATGAAAGAALVLTINWATGTQLHVPAVSLAGAAGVLAVTQGLPIWAAIFVWELARPPLWLFLLFLLTATAAHGLKVLAQGRTTTHAG